MAWHGMECNQVVHILTSSRARALYDLTILRLHNATVSQPHIIACLNEESEDEYSKDDDNFK